MGAPNGPAGHIPLGEGRGVGIAPVFIPLGVRCSATAPGNVPPGVTGPDADCICCHNSNLFVGSESLA